MQGVFVRKNSLPQVDIVWYELFFIMNEEIRGSVLWMK
jgi:hypothetical protein